MFCVRVDWNVQCVKQHTFLISFIQMFAFFNLFLWAHNLITFIILALWQQLFSFFASSCITCNIMQWKKSCCIEAYIFKIIKSFNVLKFLTVRVISQVTFHVNYWTNSLLFNIELFNFISIGNRFTDSNPTNPYRYSCFITLN